MIDELRAQGGKHLVFVRYAPGRASTHEWVYNGADIPNQDAVWARSQGRDRDAALALVETARTWRTPAAILRAYEAANRALLFRHGDVHGAGITLPSRAVSRLVQPEGRVHAAIVDRVIEPPCTRRPLRPRDRPARAPSRRR